MKSANTDNGREGRKEGGKKGLDSRTDRPTPCAISFSAKVKVKFVGWLHAEKSTEIASHGQIRITSRCLEKFSLFGILDSVSFSENASLQCGRATNSKLTEPRWYDINYHASNAITLNLPRFKS